MFDDKKAIILFSIWVAIMFGILGTVGYVAYHFISKFW